MIDIEPARLAGGMELWFHLRQLPKLAKLYQTKQLSSPKYAYVLQQERDRLTKLTLALAELVDALGDEIADLQQEHES